MKIKGANEKWEFLDSVSQKTDELRVARVGEYNFVQRSADQDRYNRLLGPVFQPEHRDKIRSYIAELNSRVI